MTCLWKHRGEVEVQLQPIHNFGPRGGGGSAPHLGRFTPGKDAVPTVPKVGWATGSVWRGRGNVAPTGIQSPLKNKQIRFRMHENSANITLYS
jgi:hypothetical protein